LEQNEDSKKISVMIESDLFHDLEKMIQGTGFASVEDYVNYVLRTQTGKKSEALTSEDTEVIMSRLKALGYI
jgi:hypothetical protein